jgi:hypothetical protein
MASVCLISRSVKKGLNEFSTMLKTMEYMILGKPIVAFDLAEACFW